MANTVKIRGYSPLVGGGFNSSGSPVQAKRVVWGTFSITSYSAGATGEAFAPEDVGLNTLDMISFNVTSVDGGAIAEGNGARAQWDGGTSIYVWDTLGESGTIVESDSASEIRFLAIGDFAGAPDLL